MITLNLKFPSFLLGMICIYIIQQSWYHLHTTSTYSIHLFFFLDLEKSILEVKQQIA